MVVPHEGEDHASCPLHSHQLVTKFWIQISGFIIGMAAVSKYHATQV